jgi:sugar diacid utilization regulator
MDRAAALGLDLAHPHRLGLVLAEPGAGSPSRVGAARDAAGAAASFLVGRYDDAAVVLIPAHVDALETMRRVRDAVSADPAGDGAPVVAVLGPEVADPAGYAQAYRLAANAAGLRRGSGDDGVLDLHTLGITALLLRTELPPAELRRFAEAGLRPLHSHDERRQGDLVGTLRCWLAAGCSTAATAAALVVHVNTVAYRLARIEELLGRDLRRFDVRLELQLAVLVWDVMHRAGS